MSKDNQDIKYICHTEKIFEIIHKIHMSLDKNRIKCMRREPQQKYSNVP